MGPHHVKESNCTRKINMEKQEEIEQEAKRKQNIYLIIKQIGFLSSVMTFFRKVPLFQRIQPAVLF